MNAYILNGMAGHYYRKAVSEGLGIHWNDIYKTVKTIENDGTLILHDKRRFKVVLEYLGND